MAAMRTDQDMRRALEHYADMVWRLCIVRVKNSADAEDIFQEVFLKYALTSQVFANEEHEKAWLIRVALNCCKDWLKGFWRKHVLSLPELFPQVLSQSEEAGETLAAVLALPPKYRDLIYLHYYEGYSAVEIAAILGKKPNTIYTRLARARALLRKQLGGDGDGGKDPLSL